MKTITILPAYKEQGKVGKTVKSILPYCKDVVVVVRPAGDKTEKEAEEAGAKVISFPIRGVGAAIRKGIEYAGENNYDVCVVMGSDCQDDPSEMHKHLAKINEGWDLVQGSRYIHEDSKSYPLFRKITTKIFTKTFQLATFSRACTDASNGFRAFKTSWAKTLDLWRDELNDYELEPYMLIQAVKQGKYTEVPVKKYYPEGQSYTKMTPFISWYRICKPMFREIVRWK